MRQFIRAVGWPLIAAVLLVPLLVAAITAALTPRLVATNYQASAQVPLSATIGTRAAYEVSSLVADFGVAYMGPGAALAAENTNPGALGPSVDATRQGDSSSVHVTFTATSQEAAEAGLRSAVQTGMTSIADSAVQRATMEAAGARSALESIVDDSKSEGSGTADTTARQAVLQQAGSNVANAESALATAKVAAKNVPQQARDLQITTVELSSIADQIRVILTATVSSFIIACLLAYFVWRARQKTARTQFGWSFNSTTDSRG